jgi:hypothetical protein
MIQALEKSFARALAAPGRRAGWLAVAVALVFGPFGARPAAAQQKKAPVYAPAARMPQAPGTPRQTLIAVLSAACAQNAQQFSRYLLAGSRKTFAALPQDRQKTLLKRFAMTSLPGHAHPFLDTEGRTVVRCDTPAETVTFRMDRAQVDQNVAFIPVTVSGGEKTQFGMVRQPGGWRMYSLGLLVINVPALVQQWEEAEMAANEHTAIADLVVIEQAVKTYHNAFGRWPQMLAQLGPAPPNEVSPERAQILPARLASGAADGYKFRYRLVTGTNGEIEGFELGAVPERYGKTGRRSFFLDTKGQLHAADNAGAPATDSDPLFRPQSESSSQ